MRAKRLQRLLLFTAMLLLVLVALFVRQQAAQPDFVHQPKPDFAAFKRVEEKKRAFVDYMHPRIVAANQKVRKERVRIAELQARLEAADVGGEACEYIGELTIHYEIETDSSDDWCDDEETLQQVFEILLRRVDIVPVALALAQAAKESGWGTSRFAVDGHNYFGQHCYVEGCGEMPKRRAPGRTHEVAIFDSSWHGVETYLLNLNTHPRYKTLREARQRIRRGGQKPTGVQLAGHLEAYSERGKPTFMKSNR